MELAHLGRLTRICEEQAFRLRGLSTGTGLAWPRPPG